MKIDIDTIFYIIISIIILALTGLTRRKKKTAIPKPVLDSMREQRSELSREEGSNDNGDIISDPFDRLEKLFAEPEPDSVPQAVSLEEIIDEETEYMKEKEAASNATPPEKEITKEDLSQKSFQTQDEDKVKKIRKLKLFGNVDEFKKAVIYTEIMNRKQY